MKEQFISYEQAFALKKLGFNEVCFKSYNSDKYFDKNVESIEEWWVKAPLYQQAFDFIRQEYRLFVVINITITNEYYFTIYGLNNKRNAEIKLPDENFPTYFQARTSCLTKLIKLFKK